MNEWLFIAMLTFSSSIDNLGVGLSYGIRNIRIRWPANILIAIICFAFSMGGIYFGLWISSILPGMLPIILGAFILVIIGLRIMLLAVPCKKQEAPQAQISPVEKGKLRSVFKDPTRADWDQSNSIGLLESIILGIALSANALTNGIGAGLLGFSPLTISILSALGSFVAVWAGVAFGVKLMHVRIGKFTIGQFGTLISGLLLMLVALNAFLD